jgi:hypothetical protein
VRRRSLVAVGRLMLLPLAASACGTTSEIENKSGGVVEARILGGSPGSVYLAGRNHERFTMRRDDIADVDFPGNVLMAGGLALTAVGVWRLRVGDTRCAAFGQVGTCAVNVVPAIAGLLAVGWGLYSYVRAKRAFADRSKPEPDPVMTPRPPGAPGPALQLPGWRRPDPFAEPRP